MSLKDIFKQNADVDDLPFGQNTRTDVAFDLDRVSDPERWQELSSDKLFILSDEDISNLKITAGLDPKAKVSDEHFPRIMAVFEQRFPELASALKQKYPDVTNNIMPLTYKDFVRDIIVQSTYESSPSNVNLESDRALIMSHGADLTDAQRMSGFMGVTEEEFPGIPQHIAQNENFRAYLDSFVMYHELEHGHDQPDELNEFRTAAEIDSDLGAFLAMDDAMPEEIRDYIVDARIISSFKHGFQADIPHLISNYDPHDHSTGLALDKMIKNGDVFSRAEMSQYENDMVDLTAKIRNQIVKLPEDAKPYFPTQFKSPAIGQIMTATNRLLEAFESGEVDLNENQQDMAHRFLEAAENSGFKRQETESYTAEYQNEYRQQMAALEENLKLNQVESIIESFIRAVDDSRYKGIEYGEPLPQEFVEGIKNDGETSMRILMEHAIQNGIEVEVRQGLTLDYLTEWDRLEPEIKAAMNQSGLEDNEPTGNQPAANLSPIVAIPSV